MTRPRTLTVICHTGLVNRMFVLASALTLAEAAGRDVRLLWPRTQACGAAFEDLFEGDWPVESLEADTLDWPLLAPPRGRPMPDLLADDTPDLQVRHWGRLIDPSRFWAHARLAPRCEAVFNQLRPRAEILARAEAFRRERFRPRMIGVHARRGDFSSVFPQATANFDSIVRAVEGYLAFAPSAGIYLCSDDGAPDPYTGATTHEGVRERLRDHFGARLVVSEPRTYARDSTDAIQDALLELWLLRQTNFFVGTSLSSFSAGAAYGRIVPHIFCGGSVRRAERLFARVRNERLRAMLSRAYAVWSLFARPVVRDMAKSRAPRVYFAWREVRRRAGRG